MTDKTSTHSRSLAAGQAQGDLTIEKTINARIANYIKVLGMVQLLGLNIGGFFWLAWANGIRSGKQSSRRWVIGIHSIYLAGCAWGIILWLQGLDGALRLTFYGSPIEVGRFVVLGGLIAVGCVYGLPVLWLLSRAARKQFEAQQAAKSSGG